MRFLGVETGHPVPLFCNWNDHMLFSSRTCVPKKFEAGKKGVWFSKQPHLLFIFIQTFLYLLCQPAQTKVQEMGGTEQDSRWAAMIKAMLTQMDTQVVQPLSFHVAHVSRNHAGKCTFFLFSSIVLCVFPSLCLTSSTAPSNTWIPWIHKPCELITLVPMRRYILLSSPIVT